MGSNVVKPNVLSVPLTEPNQSRTSKSISRDCGSTIKHVALRRGASNLGFALRLN